MGQDTRPRRGCASGRNEQRERVIDLSGGISNPLIQACIVVGVGAVALVFRRWRTCGVLCATALAWAWLCATPAFSLLLWQGLAHPYPTRPAAAYPHADAIVLIGGAQTRDALGTWIAADDPALSTPLGVAVALYHAHKAPVIVATSNYATTAAAHALVRQGIPAAALRLEPASKTTHQDATDSRSALRQLHANSILLVTTGSHMPRTVATFRKLGFAVVPAPTHQPTWLHHWPTSLTPRNTALYLSRSWLHEYIGLAYYRLRGWAVW